MRRGATLGLTALLCGAMLGAGSAQAKTSADQGQIVFTSALRDGGTQISTMFADGSHRRLISSSRVDHSPRWSPDGSRIVFVSSRDGVDNVYTMAPDGSDVTELTHDTDPFESNAQPDYAPDGGIVWIRSNALELTTAIWEMDSDGSNAR